MKAILKSMEEDEERADQWEVEKVVGHKLVKKGRTLYCVKWKSFSSCYNEWIAEEDTTW